MNRTFSQWTGYACPRGRTYMHRTGLMVCVFGASTQTSCMCLMHRNGPVMCFCASNRTSGVLVHRTGLVVCVCCSSMVMYLQWYLVVTWIFATNILTIWGWGSASVKNTWCRHKMETFSALLALWEGNPPVTGDVKLFCFYLRLNIRLSKQSKHRWFETQSRSLWRQCNDSFNDIIFTGSKFGNSTQMIFTSDANISQKHLSIFTHIAVKILFWTNLLRHMA